MTQKIISLTEYRPLSLTSNALTPELGAQLWQNYDQPNSILKIDFPSPKTQNQWKLTAQGWVGYIPLSSEYGIHLKPKVELHNLFGMLEYAYDLKSFKFLDGFYHCESLNDFYDRLASILADRILDRTRKGLYKIYIPRTEQLSWLRGRIDLKGLTQQPWNPSVKCHFEIQSPDIEDNQILLWTLWQIARNGSCSDRALYKIRRAYHALQGSITLQPCSPKACIDRSYNRLNQDYQPLHALCRFFLDQAGPQHQRGDQRMLPFLVNMPRLYEQFVAEWLTVNRQSNLLPHHLDIKAQERVNIGQNKATYFNIDLVMRDVNTNATRYVLDTKYKAPDHPSSSDVKAMIAYAAAKNCTEAVLIYPQPLSRPLNAMVQNIRIRTLTFGINGPLEKEGQNFLQSLFQST